MIRYFLVLTDVEMQLSGYLKLNKLFVEVSKSDKNVTINILQYSKTVFFSNNFREFIYKIILFNF